ncbi:TMhelix containing protein [Vibrio phage vB_VhaP_PG11]|nr:TMhelix containing protein [Vibrio phage vB_VhaP_PG11]
MKAKLITALLANAGNIKKWIFADGKFSLQRALILVVMFLAILLSVQYFGAANTEIALDFLDEVSDIIGYEE